MTPKIKWILVVVGIILVLGVGAYASKSSILSHYNKFVDDEVARRTKEIKKTYEDEKAVLQGQIKNDKAEISKKTAQIAEKNKEIKKSNIIVAGLQKKNAELLDLLNKIILPVTPEETKKRLKGLGYEVCR